MEKKGGVAKERVRWERKGGGGGKKRREEVEKNKGEERCGKEKGEMWKRKQGEVERKGNVVVDV